MNNAWKLATITTHSKAMNFISKSKSYLLANDDRSTKKRISFGFTNNRPVYTDTCISFPEANTSCVLQKVHSHECIESLLTNKTTNQEDLTPTNEKLVNFKWNFFWIFTPEWALIRLLNGFHSFEYTSTRKILNEELRLRYVVNSLGVVHFFSNFNC